MQCADKGRKQKLVDIKGFYILYVSIKNDHVRIGRQETKKRKALQRAACAVFWGA
ncbi:Hypothetical protein ETEE_0027 [Edwardsiella anguillarum ET080813]|uniref:Uncharacterized protein n=1 Tax=Edwardsiella anguillarum ET080813 TaxID=667120 RepID=A0A076LJ00_9GAMM|nr:Hypothetical protein ETEE_0027 [Edwardsiella anguillarum ET080813]